MIQQIVWSQILGSRAIQSLNQTQRSTWSEGLQSISWSSDSAFEPGRFDPKIKCMLKVDGTVSQICI